MFRFTLIILAVFICALNADNSEIQSTNQEKGEIKVQKDEQNRQLSPEDIVLAVINNDTPLSSIKDLAMEGQANEVVIRAKRYYGCGCGCGCGTCATVDPTATVAACGCGCGYG